MALFKALQDIHYGKRYSQGDIVETSPEQAAEAVTRGWLQPVKPDRPQPKSSNLENPKAKK